MAKINRKTHMCSFCGCGSWRQRLVWGTCSDEGRQAPYRQSKTNMTGTGQGQLGRGS